MFKRLTTTFISKLLAFPIMMLFAVTPASAEATLVMAEETGCVWCARWNAEIGPIYPLTHEGVAAPLRRINIDNPIPDDIQLARRVTFTPTFILVVDGTERNRIEGYPEEDFFWGLLGQMLEQEGIEFELKQGN